MHLISISGACSSQGCQGAGGRAPELGSGAQASGCHQPRSSHHAGSRARRCWGRRGRGGGSSREGAGRWAARCGPSGAWAVTRPLLPQTTWCVRKSVSTPCWPSTASVRPRPHSSPCWCTRPAASECWGRGDTGGAPREGQGSQEGGPEWGATRGLLGVAGRDQGGGAQRALGRGHSDKGRWGLVWGRKYIWFPSAGPGGGGGRPGTDTRLGAPRAGPPWRLGHAGGGQGSKR